MDDAIELRQLPTTFAETRLALHRLTVYVVATAQRVSTGALSLRASEGGFTTQPYGDGERLRVEGVELVHEQEGSERRRPITTLREAATFAGVALDTSLADEFDVPSPGDPDTPLDVDPAAAAVVAGLVGLAFDVLGTLVAEAAPGDGAGEPKLWPEHFDVAIELGPEAAGRRGTYGVSPGDASHREPYLYASPWRGAGGDPFFADGHFPGASVAYSAFHAPDARGAALAFFRQARGLILEA